MAEKVARPLQNHLYGSVRVLTSFIHVRILTKEEIRREHKCNVLAAVAAATGDDGYTNHARTRIRRGPAPVHNAHDRAHGVAPLQSRGVRVCEGYWRFPSPCHALDVRDGQWAVGGGRKCSCPRSRSRPSHLVANSSHQPERGECGRTSAINVVFTSLARAKNAHEQF